MRNFFILSFLLLLCFGANAQNNCLQKDSLSVRLLNALQNQNYQLLQAIQPSVVVLKKGFGNELKSLSDANIQKMISDNPKTKADWNLILKDAKAKKINLEHLNIESVKLENSHGENSPLAALIIKFILDNQSFELSIAVVRDGNCLYFNEFLITTGIWENK